MEKLLKKIYLSKKSTSLLKAVSLTCTVLGIIGFFATGYLSYEYGILETVKLALLHAVPFVIVSLSRCAFDAPRPYELYDFYEVKPKDKRGKSFPSRHVFSSFLIASFALYYSVPLGLILVFLSLLLATARVLLGIHFIRDCVAGALLGAVSGAIGILVLHFI